ncbi:MAG: 4Fe-4S dicluster domain-containing protein [Flavobacteriales bacterium]
MTGQLVFIAILLISIIPFAYRVKKIRRNILLGRDEDRSDRKGERWRVMGRVAIGQSKMVSRPIAGFFHILIYAGFIIINLEVLEIILDGVLGTHRLFESLGGIYSALIAAFEILAALVFLACVVFLIRRNILKIRRFHLREMSLWPKSDANIILIWEIVLMGLFLTMNAADGMLIAFGNDPKSGLPPELQHYKAQDMGHAFIVSQWIMPLLSDVGSLKTLAFIERFCWWGHIVGILGFLNYIPYSKHFHIFLAFPNTFYSDLDEEGKFDNLSSITQEVKLMMDPNADPFAGGGEEGGAEGEEEPDRFGAKDATDLTWKNLLDAYSCTECGRCSSVCPANQTGKLLSPRKIMMDTRDRIEEVGKGIDKNGRDHDDGKALLGDYITQEELWACTTCNACVEACPVNIDPLSIIVDLRRFLVMEKSEVPEALASMATNMENNGAPWQFSPADRFNWAQEDDPSDR